MAFFEKIKNTMTAAADKVNDFVEDNKLEEQFSDALDGVSKVVGDCTDAITGNKKEKED